MKMQLLLIAAMFHLAVSAQETAESLLSGDKCWTMLLKMVLPPEYGDIYAYDETRLEGDTLIDGIHFKRKLQRNWRTDETLPRQWTESNEYVGQSDGKVYLYRHTSGTVQEPTRLNMDFHANVGDVVQVGAAENGDFYTVLSVSETVFPESDDKNSRRCLLVRYGYTSQTDLWIEGIGSICFGISSTVPSGGAVPHLLKCTDRDKLLYQWDRQKESESLLSGDKCWTMRNKLVVPPDLGDQYRFTELTLKEDTLIDGMRFRKIMKRSRHQDEAEYGEWLYGHSALGQQGDKVYLYSDTYKCSRLIMDFSADYLSTVPVGVFSGEETDFLITSAADTMYVTPDGTFTRRCLHAQSVAVPAFTDVWVSGVGSLIYGIESNIGASGAVPQLWKVVSDGMIIYQREQETVGVESTAITPKTANIVFDLQGRRVTGQPHRGVYIQNGRKRVR